MKQLYWVMVSCVPHPLYGGGKKVEYPLVKCLRCGLPYVDAPIFA